MLIRPLNQEDMPQIVDLLATRDELDREGAERRAGIMEWIAFNNPFAEKGQATYYVAEDNGRVVAIHGRMPIDFSVKGESRRGYYVHDLYVHREYRERGQGFWLTMALAKAIEKETDSFVCLFGMTPLNVEMQRRRKYHEMVFDAYVKVLRPEEALSRYVRTAVIAGVLQPLVYLGLRLADFFLLPRADKTLSVVQIKRFDAGFDELFKRIAPALGICTMKTSGYLNWKYGDGPSRKDVVFAVMHGTEMRGFVVTGFAPGRGFPVGIIKDIVADPEDHRVVFRLALAGIRHLEDQGVCSIRCVVSDPRFAKILRRLLFFRMKDHEMIFLGNIDKSPVNAELLCDIRNWHITLGESDIFMLSGGVPPVQDDDGILRIRHDQSC